EVHGFREDLFLASAGANRLVVEPHGGIDLGVFIEPFRVDRVRERGARAVDEQLGGGGGRNASQRKGQQSAFGNEVHDQSVCESYQDIGERGATFRLDFELREVQFGCQSGSRFQNAQRR